MVVRVLHYVGRMKRGGMETFIMNLYRGIDTSVVQFDFAVHEAEEGEYDNEILQRGGRIYHFPHMRENPFVYRKSWKDFWKDHKDEYRAFHFHTNSLANIIAFDEAYKAGIPVRIVHAHSSFANKGRLQFLNDYLHHRHQKMVTNEATNLLACSDKAATWLFGQGSSQVEIIKNGIHLKDFAFCERDRENVRNEFQVGSSTILIGHVAAFLEVKNHKYDLEIAQALKAMSADFEFVLVGDGPLLNDIKNAVDVLGLEENFVFTGTRSDVSRLLSGFDVVILPSLYEGLPVSLIEAQVNGVSVLVSDTIAKEVKIADNLGFSSIGVPASSWAQKIVELPRQHTSDIERITKAGYNIEDVCKTYYQLLRVDYE